MASYDPSNALSDGWTAPRAYNYAGTALVFSPAEGAVPVRFTAGTAVVGVSGSDEAYFVRTLTGARLRVAGAPVGSNLIIQIQYSTNSGSTWNTLSTLTMNAGSTTEVSAAFSRTQAVGELLRLNVTDNGATTAATGVVLDVLVA